MKRYLAILSICAFSLALTGQALAAGPKDDTYVPPTNQTSGDFQTHPYRHLKPVAIHLGLQRINGAFHPYCTKDAVSLGHTAGRQLATCQDYVGKDGNTYRLVVMHKGSEPVLIARMDGGYPLALYEFKTDGVVALNGAPNIGTAPPVVAERQLSPEEALRKALGTILRGK